jgi:hypothetical protein
LAFEITYLVIKRLIFILILTLQTAALAAPACSALFEEQTPAVKKIVMADPYLQWREWEQSANNVQFRKLENYALLEVSAVPSKTAEIKKSPGASPELEKLFINGTNVVWPKHPYNTADAIPHFNDPAHPTLNIKAYFTASRSMSIETDSGAFTIKMGTNHPHGKNSPVSKEKISTKEDIDKALLRTQYIESVDAKIGKDPDLIIAKDVFSVADKKTGEGFIVRDVSFLKDGFYYLPAFSIPFVGRKIAKLNNRPFVDFWAENYSAVLGRAKAKLLLRYGFQMETPNPQNMLRQFDRNLRPTGVTVFRDISDTNFVGPVAEALGEKQALLDERAAGYEPDGIIILQGSNSHGFFNSAGENSFKTSDLVEMVRAHDYAFRKEIERLLGVRIPSVSNKHADDVMAFLKSDLGQKKLKQYRDSLIQNAAHSK